MLGVVSDSNGQRGFWDLDAQEYVPYDIGESLVTSSENVSIFEKTDPKTFNNYDLKYSTGETFSPPSYNVSWTGGMDDNPSYVEISTSVDWTTLPGNFIYAVLGIGMTAGMWMTEIPVTPQDNKGYIILTGYVGAMRYFVTEEYTKNRIPVIHP